MSHCWPRSRSPVGSNVVFFNPRVLTSASLRPYGGFLCLSLLSCALYRNDNTSSHADLLIR